MHAEAESRNGPTSGLKDDVRRGTDEVRGISEELGGIADDLRDLVRTEVELAKAEVREQVSLVVKSAIFAGVALVAAMLTLIWVALTATYALDLAMPLWLAALIVTVALGAVAAISGLMVKSRMKQVSVVPKRTMNSVKEDVTWAKQQLKSNTNSSASATP